jgi:pimeloyl-ACP methyl ester carboxylesterase
MPVIRLPHGKTFYVREGEGPPIVLIHGMGGDHTLWNGQASALKDRFSVIRPDNLGHGRSQKPLAPWTFSLFARQIVELLDHLGISRAIICGFSLGGSIAQAVAMEHPRRAAGVIIVSSVCARTEAEQAAVDRRVADVRKHGPAGAVEGALQRWFSPEFARSHPDVIAYWRRMVLSNSRRMYAAVYQLYSEVDRQLLGRQDRIEAPTLVITGDRDSGQPPRMSEELGRRIRNADVRIFPGIPHMLPIEAADELSAAIAEFARQHPV